MFALRPQVSFPPIKKEQLNSRLTKQAVTKRIKMTFVVIPRNARFSQSMLSWINSLAQATKNRPRSHVRVFARPKKQEEEAHEGLLMSWS